MAQWEMQCYKIFGVSSFSLDYDNPHLFVNSQWADACRGCAVVYGAYRVAVATFWVGVVLSYALNSVDWLLPASSGTNWFLFLTNWSLMLVTADALLQAITWIVLRCKKTQLSGKNANISLVMKIEWIIFNIALCSGIISTLVDGVYVAAMADNPNLHGLFIYVFNSVYLIVNLFIVGIPLRFFHFLHTTIFLLIFIGISAMKQYLDGVQVYTFINWSSPLSVGLYLSLGVLFGVMAIWSLLVLLFLFRLRIAGGNKKVTPIAIPPYNPFQETFA